MKSNSFFCHQDLYLALIFILMAIAIVFSSHFSANGYLTSDSTNYLILAQNLIDGNGYYVTSSNWFGDGNGQGRVLFAIWPIGYPTFIAFVAKLTGLSVFWASKLLNILLIGIILAMFRLMFKQNASTYGLIFFFSAYIELFSYTWSETIFIVSLVWFAFSIHLCITNNNKMLFVYISILFSSLLLFFSRYIGAFSFGLIGLLSFYYALIKKEKHKAIILISIALINIIIMILYLYNNYIETGFFTGMKRIPSWETKLELLFVLFRAMMSEIVIPVKSMSYETIIKYFFYQVTISIILLWKFKKNIWRTLDGKKSRPISLSIVFVFIGMVYLFFIIFMRFLSHFDEFSYRLLSPGSFLIFVGLIFFLQQRTTEKFFTAFKIFLILFALLSYNRNVPKKVKKLQRLNPTYSETLIELKEKYSNIDNNSVIVFGSDHINYLYSDIWKCQPYSFPLSNKKENWSDFMNRINPDNKMNIYLEVPNEKLSNDKFHYSILQVVDKYNKGALVKIK